MLNSCEKFIFEKAFPEENLSFDKGTGTYENQRTSILAEGWAKSVEKKQYRECSLHHSYHYGWCLRSLNYGEQIHHQDFNSRQECEEWAAANNYLIVRINYI